MPVGLNGTEILLYVDSGAGPVLIGSQRGLSRDESVEEIDVSSKVSPAKRILPGRYGSSLSFEALYIPTDSGFLALRAAHRNREEIIVVIEEEGVYLESAAAYVMGMSEDYPDQGESTVSADVTIDGEWSMGT